MLGVQGPKGQGPKPETPKPLNPKPKGVGVGGGRLSFSHFRSSSFFQTSGSLEAWSPRKDGKGERLGSLAHFSAGAQIL